jgi:hypothetical protein
MFLLLFFLCDGCDNSKIVSVPGHPSKTMRIRKTSDWWFINEISRHKHAQSSLYACGYWKYLNHHTSSYMSSTMIKFFEMAIHAYCKHKKRTVKRTIPAPTAPNPTDYDVSKLDLSSFSKESKKTVMVTENEAKIIDQHIKRFVRLLYDIDVACPHEDYRVFSDHPKYSCEYWSKVTKHFNECDYLEGLNGLSKYVCLSKILWCKYSKILLTAEQKHKKKLKRERQRQLQLRRARMRALAKKRRSSLSAKETKENKCDPERYAELKKAVSIIKTFFKHFKNRYMYLMMDKYQIFVSKPGGIAGKIKVWSSGEHHLFILSYSKLKLKLYDQNGYLQKTQSSYTHFLNLYRILESGGYIITRKFETNSGEVLKIKLEGSGCTLLLLFKNYRG